MNGVVDAVVPEPLGAAHREPHEAIESLGDTIADQLKSMSGLSAAELIQQRQDKYLAIGDKGLA